MAEWKWLICWEFVVGYLFVLDVTGNLEDRKMSTFWDCYGFVA